MNAVKNVMSIAFAAVSIASHGYHFSSDFSVVDAAGSPYCIDVERNTRFSHGHAYIDNGRYAIPVNANRHFLATPKLRDFRLEADFSQTEIRPHDTGLTVWFRDDRTGRTGHKLVAYWDFFSKFFIYLDGKEIYSRLRPEGKDLAIRIVVGDDIHHPGEKGYKMYEGDGFQLMMVVPGQSGIWEIGGSWYEDESTDVWVWGAPEGVDTESARGEIRLTAHRDMTVPKNRRKPIWYDLRIPFRLLGTDAAGLRKSGLLLNAMINDNDGRCREGYMSFCEGNPKDPDNFLAVDFE